MINVTPQSLKKIFKEFRYDDYHKKVYKRNHVIIIIFILVYQFIIILNEH